MKPSGDRNLSWDTPYGKAEVTRRGPLAPTVRAATSEALLFSLGRLHAEDRRRQILLARAITRGELGTLVKDSPAVREIDLFHRLFDHQAAVETEIASLDAGAKALLHAYSDGINAGLSKKSGFLTPCWGKNAPRWSSEDSLLIARTLGLDSWFEVKLPTLGFLARLIGDRTPLPHLKELFPEITLEPDRKNWEGLADQITLSAEALDQLDGLPRWRSSVFWGVQKAFTASGKNLIAGSLNTEISTLPSPFYEAVLEGPEGPWRGCGIPGLPVFMVGRTRSLAWSLAPVLDEVMDLRIEKISGEDYWDGQAWQKMGQRTESFAWNHQEQGQKILRLIKNAVLWPDSRLSVSWAGQAASGTLNGLLGLFRCETAAQAMASLSGKGSAVLEGLVTDEEEILPVKTGRIWAWADGHSWIPAPSWETGSRALGASTSLQGSLIQQDGRVFPHPQNGQRPLARERLFQLLLQKTRVSEADQHSLFRDDYSLWAQRLRTEIRFLFSDSPQGQLLRSWSCHAAESGMPTFEALYRALIQGVFAPIDGTGHLWHDIHGEAVAFNALVSRFDRVLLNAESPWFGGREREEVFSEILHEFFTHNHETSADSFRWRGRVHSKATGVFKQLTPVKLLYGRSLLIRTNKEIVGTHSRTYGPSVRFCMDFKNLSLSVSSLFAPHEDPGQSDGQPNLEDWADCKFHRL